MSRTVPALVLSALILLLPAASPARALGDLRTVDGEAVEVTARRAIVCPRPDGGTDVVLRLRVDAPPGRSLRWTPPEGTLEVGPVLGDPFVELDGRLGCPPELLLGSSRDLPDRIAAPSPLPAGEEGARFPAPPDGWIGDILVTLDRSAAEVTTSLASEGLVACDVIGPTPDPGEAPLLVVRDDRGPAPLGTAAPSLAASLDRFVLPSPARLVGLGGEDRPIPARAVRSDDPTVRRAGIVAASDRRDRAEALIHVVRNADLPVRERLAALAGIGGDPGGEGSIGNQPGERTDEALLERHFAGLDREAFSRLLDGVRPDGPPALLHALATRLEAAAEPGGNLVGPARDLIERLLPATGSEQGPALASVCVAAAHLAGGPVRRPDDLDEPAVRATVLWREVQAGDADLGAFLDLVEADPTGPAAAIALLAGTRLPDRPPRHDRCVCPTCDAHAPWIRPPVDLDEVEPAYALAVLRAGRARSDEVALRAAATLLRWAEGNGSTYLGSADEVRAEARATLDRLVETGPAPVSRVARHLRTTREHVRAARATPEPADATPGSVPSEIAPLRPLLSAAPLEATAAVLREVILDGRPHLALAAANVVLEALHDPVLVPLPDLAPTLWRRVGHLDRGVARGALVRVAEAITLAGPAGDALRAARRAGSPSGDDLLATLADEEAAPRVRAALALADASPDPAVTARALSAACRLAPEGEARDEGARRLSGMAAGPGRLLARVTWLAVTDDPVEEDLEDAVADVAAGGGARTAIEALARLGSTRPERAGELLRALTEHVATPPPAALASVVFAIASAPSGEATLRAILETTESRALAAAVARGLPVDAALEVTSGRSDQAIRSEVRRVLGARDPARGDEIAERLGPRETPEARRARTRYGQGRELERVGSDEEAVEAYREAVELDPGLTDAWYELGHLLRDLDRDDEAIEAYRALLDHDPDHARGWNSLGAAHHRSNRLEEALRCYREALDRIEDDDSSDGVRIRRMGRFNEGLALHHLGRAEDAIRAYRRALELTSDYTVALTGLGRALLAAGRPGEAIPHLERAHRRSRDDDDPDPLPDLVRALARDGRYAEAAHRAHLGLERDPSKTAYRLAYVDVLLGHPIPEGPSVAETVLGGALSRDRANPRVHARLAWLHARRSRGSDARREAETALDLASSPEGDDLEESLADLAEVLARARLEQAVPAADRLVELRGTAPDHLLRARALAGAGRIEEARETLAAHREAGGTKPGEGWFAVGCALARAGRDEEALDALERAASTGVPGPTRFRTHPDLADLRFHPRFRALLRRDGR